MRPAPDRPTTHRRLLAAAAASAALLGIAALLALGGGGASSDESDLPTLPPEQEQQPALYDDEGCVVGGLEDGPDCTTTADELDQVLAGPPGDAFRTLAGFSGPRWTTETGRGELLVLEETVRAGAASDGTWQAVGLARNETGAPRGDVEVAARLLDGSGAELEVVDATIPVGPLRAGEPAPFDLSSATAHDAVVTVEWSVTGTAVDDAAATSARSAEISTYWTEPAGERTERIEVADHVDPATGPAPHLVFGSVAGVEGAELDDPAVTAAWIAEDGRVLHVVGAEVVELGTGDPRESLEEGQLGDFVLVLEAPDPEQVGTATLALWSSGT